MTDTSPTPAGHSLPLLLLVACALLLALLAEFFLPSEAEASVGTPTPPSLTARQQSLLKLLCSDVIGKPVTLEPIMHVQNWCPMEDEHGLFEHADGVGGDQAVSCRWVKRRPGEPLDSKSGAWTLNSTHKDIKYITHDSGELLLPTETDLNQGVITVFDPPEPLLLAGVPEGTPKNTAMRVSVYDMHDPSTLKYSGHLTSTYLDLGGYTLQVPHGSYEARLISVSNVGKVGPADIDTEYLAFYAKGVGRVAYINRKHISAYLFYNTTTQHGMVLSSSQPEAHSPESDPVPSHSPRP